jgi:hypothetical protein
MTNVDIPSSSENEQTISAVKLWVDRFAQTGEVGEIDPAQVREVLAICGAKVEGLSEKAIKHLNGYSNADRGLGMTEVWGKDRKKEFKDWIKEQIEYYETEKGIELPATGKEQIKYFGMIGFMEDLTSFATGAWAPEYYKEVSHARWENGRIVRDGERKKTPRLEITLPDGKELAPASYQPDFPTRAFEKILSWKDTPSHD